MSNIAQVDQSDIRKLKMRHAFLKRLIPKNQLAIEDWSYNTTISSGHIVPVITEEDVKCLGLKINWIIRSKQMPVYCSSVTHLKISYYHSLSDKKIISIVHLCPNIIHLSFIYIKGFSNKVLELIACSYSNLKYLNLCDDQSGSFRNFHVQEVDDGDLWEIIKLCHKLEYLNIAYRRGITEHSICEIANSFLNLKYLNLEGCNNISKETVDQFVLLNPNIHVENFMNTLSSPDFINTLRDYLN
ncbi:787_t:CDS:2 [Funneliformis geosporum]|uniref:787_t:CDS:1 n=1 Tax=Funneliformis geosporum TaxID=1117311 RepID=A0A9W4X606_9GLOM|nr:787_t:CDS:2 [Funneliformis geosporum]